MLHSIFISFFSQISATLLGENHLENHSSLFKIVYSAFVRFYVHKLSPHISELKNILSGYQVDLYLNKNWH